jgi:RNA polymerase sigma-70 factor (ECF subfamily)
MVEDRILVWRFNRGSKDALQRIYEKYKSDLLGLAVSLLRDRSAAEDVVHDVFVSFAKSCGTFRLNGTLKGYLSTCVANCARDRNRLKSGRDARLDAAAGAAVDTDGPVGYAMDREEAGKVQGLLGRLPYEQREIIVLHLHQGMRFWEIARALNVSINTVQSRYRYGLEKLRSLTNGEVAK